LKENKNGGGLQEDNGKLRWESLNRILQQLTQMLSDKLHLDNLQVAQYILIGLSFIILILSVNGFVEITESLFENELLSYDQYFSELVLSWRNPTLTFYFQNITHLGDRWTYLIILGIAVVVALIKKIQWNMIFQTGFVLLMAAFSNLVLKRVIDRQRPAGEHLVETSSQSFPSYHAMASTAFYGFLIYLAFQYLPNNTARYLSIGLLVLIILSINISRIYLGVHYPSDVAAGFLGGLVWIAFCIFLFNMIYLVRRRRKTKKSL
jgi:undecaprenyl-diphosphatase